MNRYDEEKEEYIKGIRGRAEEIRNMPPEEARKAAIKSLYIAGICTKNGKLRAHYRKNLEA